MYSNRPSKQHQKKGLQLFKKMIKSQRKTSVSNINVDFNPMASSETSIKDQLEEGGKGNNFGKPDTDRSNKCHVRKSGVLVKDINWSKEKIRTEVSLVGGRMTDSLRVGGKTRNGLQDGNRMMKASVRRQRDRIDDDNESNKSISSLQQILIHNNDLSSNIKKDLNPNTNQNILMQSATLPQSPQLIKSLKLSRNIPHHPNPLTSSIALHPHLPFHHSSYPTSSNLQRSTFSRSLEQINPTFKSYTFIEEVKKRQPSRSKERKLLEDLKQLEFRVNVERESIKKVRREFVEVLETGKRKGLEAQRENEQIDRRNKEIQMSMTLYNQQKQSRNMLLSQLHQQISTLQQNLQTLTRISSQTIFHLSTQLQRQQQTNTLITRQIFTLKNQLNSHRSQTSCHKLKQEQNKKLVRKVIEVEDRLERLRMEKAVRQAKRREETRNMFLEQIGFEDKQQIYHRLDKELNLIKEYFKVSANHKQFRRSIKRMTQYSTYPKQIQTFQTSQSYLPQIMHLYSSTLWQTQLPKFLDKEPLRLQSTRIRQLKAQLKQLDAKKKQMNEVLKEKERLVEGLGFRVKKLEEQVQLTMKKIEEDKYNVSEIDSVEWGF